MEDLEFHEDVFESRAPQLLDFAVSRCLNCAALKILIDRFIVIVDVLNEEDLLSLLLGLEIDLTRWKGIATSTRTWRFKGL